VSKISLADLKKLLAPAGFDIKRQLTVIPVDELDCKACAKALYYAVSAIDGVDQTAASVRSSKLSVWFDPQKTNRAEIEKVVRKTAAALVEPADNDAKKKALNGMPVVLTLNTKAQRHEGTKKLFGIQIFEPFRVSFH